VVLQLVEREAACLVLRGTAAHQLRVAVVEMLREFLDDLQFARRVETGGCQPRPDFGDPVRHHAPSFGIWHLALAICHLPFAIWHLKLPSR
jgi:hypothetical protein